MCLCCLKVRYTCNSTKIVKLHVYRILDYHHDTPPTIYKPINMQVSIIVPGIAGSKIYCNCNNADTAGRRLYPRKYWFFNSAIDNHLYECPNVITKILKTFWTISVYDKFIKKLSNNTFNSIQTFSYDWRRDPTNVAQDLLLFLKKCNLQQYSRVNLIGHSLGGLIIRILMEFYNGMQELRLPSPDIVTVYQCGTPMYGSLHIQDYNYGFELAAILASSGVFQTACPVKKITSRDVKRIKPFLFSVADLKKIVETTSPSLLYLLPTPMIRTIYTLVTTGQLHISNVGNLSFIHQVHMKLSNLAFPVHYVFFYNISEHNIEKVYIPFYTNDLLSKISVHEIKPGNKKLDCGIHLNRLLKSDGLVVPYSGQKIPYNCKIYVDESEKNSHGYLMNSGELLRIVTNKHPRFEYFNIVLDNDDLPGYEDIDIIN